MELRARRWARQPELTQQHLTQLCSWEIFYSNTDTGFLFLFLLEMESHIVIQARVQWHNDSSLQPQTPGLKRSSCLSLSSKNRTMFPLICSEKLKRIGTKLQSTAQLVMFYLFSLCLPVSPSFFLCVSLVSLSLSVSLFLCLSVCLSVSPLSLSHTHTHTYIYYMPGSESAMEAMAAPTVPAVAQGEFHSPKLKTGLGAWNQRLSGSFTFVIRSHPSQLLKLSPRSPTHSSDLLGPNNLSSSGREREKEREEGSQREGEKENSFFLNLLGGRLSFLRDGAEREQNKPLFVDGSGDVPELDKGMRKKMTFPYRLTEQKVVKNHEES
ncbi:hypothetical protein AAY473_031898 [Plecturocebus cupreus]